VALLLPRFRRFSTQLLLLLAGFLAIVQVLVYVFVVRANESNALDHIGQNLRSGAKIFRQNLTDRIEYLTGVARVLSNDYGMRQLIIQEPIDRETLRTTLRSYGDRLEFNDNSPRPLITLFALDGELLADTGRTDQPVGITGPFRHLIRTATENDLEQVNGYSYLGGKLHVIVVVPLYAPKPNIAGWFGLAYPIDTFASAIKSATLLDVTFTSSPGKPDLRVLSSTLSLEMADGVIRHLADHPNGTGEPQLLTLKGEQYVTLLEPLELLGEEPARIALQRSLTAEMASARELERMVLYISLAALGAATLVATGIARSVSRPMRQLASHTKLVAAGDYTQRIKLPREDELGQLATAFNQMTAGLAERDRVRNLLGMVVSPEIATQLLQSDLKLGGEEREVTMLFCDLRDFTSFSEKMPPTEVLELLNRYLDRMSSIIEQQGGVIDKYIGDAILALFGAPVAIPNAAARAITTARAMGDALDELNMELVAEGRARLAFGIGINTARVVAGNMGSKTRLNYTVIGDGVNLASRLESQTKDPAYQTPIIVSEATARAAGEEHNLRCLGSVAVKGKAEAVKIYAVDVLPRPWMKRG
jgi:adenylate cyclase